MAWECTASIHGRCLLLLGLLLLKASAWLIAVHGGKPELLEMLKHKIVTGMDAISESSTSCIQQAPGT